jgi:hypothetical protein
MGITQHGAHLPWPLLHQPGRHLVVTSIGYRQLHRQRDPDRSHRHGEMQFPAVPPAMPAGFAPACVRLNGAMGDEALFSMLCVPPPPPVASGVLSQDTARPCVAHGFNSATKCHPPYPSKPGQEWGSCARRRSLVRREGKQPCSCRSGRNCAATESSWSRKVSKAEAV